MNTIEYGQGAVNNTIGWGQGAKVGSSFSNTKSILLDGVDDFVNVADNSNLSFGNGSSDSPFSISTWVKIGRATAQGIVTKYGSGSSTREWLFYTTGGKLRLLFIDASNGANNFATGSTTLSTDTWYHVACTYDGRGGSTAYNGITLYINGVAESVTTSGGSYTAMSNTSQNVEIGKYSTNELLGNIDETAIFSSQLSQSDITAIYGTGVPTSLSSYSSLISWWRCGDGDTSPTLTDNGSGGNNGTMTNFSTFSSDVPVELFSRKSILLDGVDDYVTMGDVLDTSDTGADAFSISAWYKTSNSGTQMIVTKWSNVSPTNGFGLFLQGSSQMRFFMGSFVGNAYLNVTSNTTSSFTDGNWHHVVLTYDGSRASSGIKIYVDTSLITLNTLRDVTPVGVNNIQEFMIGVRGEASNNAFPFDGNIDEVSYFNSELSASDVTSIYNSGVPNDISSLSPLSWWRCGDGDTAPTLLDNGSASNNGTMTNFSTFSTDVPT